jgi:hypothetical protein
MAKGRPNKEPRYCDYKYIDDTYCSARIENVLINKNGKQIKKKKWVDNKRRNFCIFHSHNDKKKEEFYSKLFELINEKNIEVLKRLKTLDRVQLSEKEMKEKEDRIRNEYLLDFDGFYFPKNAIFDNFTFEAAVDFQYAEFGNKASFKWTIFLGKVSFDWVKFNGKVSFELAKFGGVVSFSWSNF